LGVIARSPLAGGYLASRRLSSGVGALRHRGARDRHAAIAAEGIWPALAFIARRHRHSPAQIALSWVLAHPQVTSALISVASVDQFAELLTATRIALLDEDMTRLGRAPSDVESGLFALRNELA
jgi:aryl-alcohol dehydrogenase-like predicted oxidoreductase